MVHLIALEYGFYRSGKKGFEEDNMFNIFIDFSETFTEISLIEFKQWYIIS